MIIRRVNGENDWQFGKGLSSYARDEQAIEQNILTRLQEWIGDCFWAKRAGIDWRARLDVGQDGNLIEEIRACILRSFGAVGVGNVVLTRDGQRRVTVVYAVETLFGETFTATVGAQ